MPGERKAQLARRFCYGEVRWTIYVGSHLNEVNFLVSQLHHDLSTFIRVSCLHSPEVRSTVVEDGTARNNARSYAATRESFDAPTMQRRVAWRSHITNTGNALGNEDGQGCFS